jgi:hypothetical protein
MINTFGFMMRLPSIISVIATVFEPYAVMQKATAKTFSQYWLGRLEGRELFNIVCKSGNP